MSIDYSKLQDLPPFAPTGPGKYLLRCGGVVEINKNKTKTWTCHGYFHWNDNGSYYSTGMCFLDIVAPAPDVSPWEECERTRGEVKYLTELLAKKFYPENKTWEACDTVSGMLSQISNICSGLIRFDIPHDYDLFKQQRDQHESELRAAEEVNRRWAIDYAAMKKQLMERISQLESERDELQNRIQKLRDRLQDQTRATQESANHWHDRVLEKINHLIPEGMNKYGHPIDQIVGTVVSTLQCERDEWKRAAERLQTERNARQCDNEELRTRNVNLQGHFTQRERFEQWYKKSYGYSRLYRDENGNYFAPIDSAWEAWQAAQVDQQAEIAELKERLKKCRELFEFEAEEGISHFVSMECDEKHEELRQAAKEACGL